MWYRKVCLVFLLYYLQLVRIKCESGISVAFAIDNTRTMGPVFDDVKKYTQNILSAVIAKKSIEIKDFVLVTINDPEVKLEKKTNSTQIFFEELKNIHVYRAALNDDCEEMSLSGIETAVENSRLGSYVFVFTDATAKDYSKVNKIKDLCQTKQIQVIFILIGDCNQSETKGFSVYYDIAEATSGQVFRVELNEVGGVTEVIKYLMNDKIIVIAKKLLPETFAYRKVEFEIDVKTTSVMMLSKSVDGDLQITNTTNLLFGHKQAVQKILWTKNMKVIELVNFKPGKYYAWVKGSSFISLEVYATTTFTFQYGFSTEDTAESLEYTSEEPFYNTGIPQHLYIQTTDDSVDIKIVTLIDMEGSNLMKLQAKRIREGFYVTPSFIVPACAFHIKITSFTKLCNQLVVGVTKTPINQFLNKKTGLLPNVTIIEKQRNFSYGMAAEFTCMVKSYTTPLIQWTAKDVSILENKANQISVFAYYSRLKVSQMKKSSVYSCIAINNFGATYVNISLDVSSPFDVKRRPEPTTEVKYGETANIICDIESDQPMNITWFKFNETIDKDSFNISSDRTMLTIKAKYLKLQGNYSCQAYLISDPTIQVKYTTKLEINGLEAPVITYGTKKYLALTGDSLLKIPCNVTGSPEPIVTWKKDGEIIVNSSKYVIQEKNLFIKDLREIDSANYTCFAFNVIGYTQRTFKAIVSDTFDKDNDALKGYTSTILAIARSPFAMTCSLNITNYTLPRWYLNGRFTNYTGTSYNIEQSAREHSGIYTCRADSNEGSSSKSFDLRVGSPPRFVYESWSKISDIEEILDCTVSEPEAEVQWFHNGMMMETLNNTQEYIANEWGEYKCVASNMFGVVERTYQIESSDCLVNKHMITQNMPLWFNEDIKDWPALSYSTGIMLAANKSILLACPSSNSFEAFPNRTNITAQCYKEDKFIVGGKTYKFSALQCKAPIEPTILNSTKECSGPHTNIIRIGFMLGTFLEGYQVCYDTKNALPVFGKTHLVVADSAKERSLFTWKKTVTGSNESSTGDLYCQNDSNCCYSKSQLVLAEDMVFGPLQAAALNNFNSIDVWVPCANESRLSWDIFESEIRSMSETKRFQTWTGASDWQNKNGGRVPAYLWKAINYNGEFTAVVYVNHPDLTKEDFLCSTSCETLGMIDQDLVYTLMSFYCCSLNEFSDAFNVTSFNKDDVFLSSSY